MEGSSAHAPGGKAAAKQKGGRVPHARPRRDVVGGAGDEGWKGRRLRRRRRRARRGKGGGRRWPSGGPRGRRECCVKNTDSSEPAPGCAHAPKQDPRVHGQLLLEVWLPCGGLPPAADRPPPLPRVFDRTLAVAPRRGHLWEVPGAGVSVRMPRTIVARPRMLLGMLEAAMSAPRSGALGALLSRVAWRTRRCGRLACRTSHGRRACTMMH